MHHHFVPLFHVWPVDACRERFDEIWLETLLRIIAQLHEHISDGGISTPLSRSSAKKVERVEAIIYTAHEIITPLDVRYPEREADDTRYDGLS